MKTYRSQKTETKTKMKKKEEKERTIKNQIGKRGKRQ
jgi:hypothetical protein